MTAPAFRRFRRAPSPAVLLVIGLVVVAASLVAGPAPARTTAAKAPQQAPHDPEITSAARAVGDRPVLRPRRVTRVPRAARRAESRPAVTPAPTPEPTAAPASEAAVASPPPAPERPANPAPKATAQPRPAARAIVTGASRRWNPCTPIGYRVNAAQADPGAISDTRKAFATIGQATGMRFVYRGTTSGIPQYGGNSWYPSDTEIVVAWARRDQSSLLQLHPGSVGVGAGLSYRGWYDTAGNPVEAITRGMVAIDSRQQYPGGFGPGVTRGDVLLHELGHVLGLGHVDSPSQLMYGRLTDGYARYGNTDLANLRNHGMPAGCLSRTR